MNWPTDLRVESQNTKKEWANVVFAYVFILIFRKDT